VKSHQIAKKMEAGAGFWFGGDGMRRLRLIRQEVGDDPNDTGPTCQRRGAGPRRQWSRVGERARICVARRSWAVLVEEKGRGKRACRLGHWACGMGKRRQAS
jgi:hypothetical protein